MTENIPMNERGSLHELSIYLEPDDSGFMGKTCFFSWGWLYPSLMRCLAKHTEMNT